MHLVIDKHSGAPVYRQMVDQLTHQILAGQLVAGEQLTSVRELAQVLGVNPMTISKVYSLLEAEGLVERRPGLGIFVADGVRVRSEKERLAILDPPLKEVAHRVAQLGIEPDRALDLFRRILRDAGAKGD